ncbi:alpha/beta fold hydrolase [Gymnodinialimonas sp. 2305UL16-5]|uniref:alpha/beta fold hydrolase n=1 Tax=Gymnodinialimonas mytili TaxID=3126503 RepID=UPI0030A660B9
MLSYSEFGDGDGPPVLIVHGLFGSGRNWGVIAKRLSDLRRTVIVDMRNHGASDWMAPHDYPAMATDLADVIAHIGGVADVIGHSMGGKAAMVLAATQPDLLRRLIVADIAPVAYTHTQSGMIEAMRAVDLSAVEARADADAQLAPHVSEPGIRAFLLQSLDVRGKTWRLNLDQLDADMPSIIGFPTLRGRFDGPVLMLSGAESDYVRPDHRPIIKDLFPKARFAKLPGAGHWLHADKPREFEAACRAFLDA